MVRSALNARHQGRAPVADQCSVRLSAVRAIAVHPFRVVKQQFGFVTVRYRGLKKNTVQIATLFALANLWMARKRLPPLLAKVRP